MFFFHGDSDELVQIRSPQKMVERLHDLGVEADFYTVKGAGHIPAAMDQGARERALAFADHVLKGALKEGSVQVRENVGARAAGTGGGDAPARSGNAVETSHAQ